MARTRHPRRAGGRSSISATVEGSDRLAAQLQDASTEMFRAVQRAIKESADAIADDTKQRVHVDTGNLRHSVSVRVDMGPVTKAEIGWRDRDDRYALWQEFGTRAMPARPALGPAANAEKRKLPDRIKAAVNGVIS